MLWSIYTGAVATPLGGGAPPAHGKRRDFREMADEENQLARHQRSPSRDGFPGLIASRDQKTLKVSARGRWEGGALARQ